MRLVLGDLSWNIRSEPWEYLYATHEKAELPHKEAEAAMLAEVKIFFEVVLCCCVYDRITNQATQSFFRNLILHSIINTTGAVITGGKCQPDAHRAFRRSLLRLRR